MQSTKSELAIAKYTPHLKLHAGYTFLTYGEAKLDEVQITRRIARPDSDDESLVVEEAVIANDFKTKDTHTTITMPEKVQFTQRVTLQVLIRPSYQSCLLTRPTQTTPHSLGLLSRARGSAASQLDLHKMCLSTTHCVPCQDR